MTGTNAPAAVPVEVPPGAPVPIPQRFGSATVWLAFVLLSLIWGSSYLFIRVGVRQLSPESLVFGRLFVGAVVIGIIVVSRGLSICVERRVLGLLVIQGTINTAVPFLLISFGEVHVASGLAAVLNGTVPIFSMLLAGVFLADEPLSSIKLVGAAAGFLGVVVLMSHGSFGSQNPAVLGGEILILLSSVSYGMGAVFARRMLRGVPSMTVAFWAVLFACVDSGIAAAISGPTNPTSLDGSSILAILWLGVLGSGVAYVLAYYVLSTWGASRTTLVAYVMPAVGLVLGVIFLGEVLDWRIVLGLLLILLSIGLASSKGILRIGRRRPVPA